MANACMLRLEFGPVGVHLHPAHRVRNYATDIGCAVAGAAVVMALVVPMVVIAHRFLLGASGLNFAFTHLPAGLGAIESSSPILSGFRREEG
ncbi:MAG: hypothetical protein ACC742_05275 [Thermoanaerobaculales bacterium]